ncbi:MAG: acyl-CoA dehydrogenase family protein, partial [Deltaproteobacteria bacterium]|nr:acyl-CoA dehydrogenase family protein [Deltaproteobacteria bacterium]
MNLLLAPAQEALRSEVRSFLEAHCPPGRVRELEASERGFCSALWQDMAQRGWLRLGHGAGGSVHETRLVDRVVYFEELG